MKRAIIYKSLAALILVIISIFWIVKGILDLFGGVKGGLNNLILAAALILLVVFDWKRPLVGGIITAFLGVILAVYFNFSLPDIYSAYIPLLLICAPMALGGLLFIEADWAKKRKD